MQADIKRLYQVPPTAGLARCASVVSFLVPSIHSPKSIAALLLLPWAAGMQGYSHSLMELLVFMAKSPQEAKMCMQANETAPC